MGTSEPGGDREPPRSLPGLLEGLEMFRGSKNERTLSPVTLGDDLGPEVEHDLESLGEAKVASKFGGLLDQTTYIESIGYAAVFNASEDEARGMVEAARASTLGQLKRARDALETSSDPPDFGTFARALQELNDAENSSAPDDRLNELEAAAERAGRTNSD